MGLLDEPRNTWKSIDLNRDYGASGEEALTTASDRVSQPMDVLITPGSTRYVVIACFGTDDVLVLEPDANADGGWARSNVDIAPLAGYGASGPRAMAYDAASGRLWVLNRLDNSLAVFDPSVSSPFVARKALSNDPTPAVVRAGQRFLYSAHLTSGEQMVACASCHVDARTDGLAWDIGDTSIPTPPKPVVPPKLKDIDEVANVYPNRFEQNKGAFVTQTLQGLVNSHIERPDPTVDLQYVTTNAPYHWRGDRNGFVDFNEAFVNLQEMPNLSGEEGLAAEGLTSADMEAFRAFIETVHYPPNPEQPLSRVYGGEIGTATDPSDGSGALRGLKNYHIDLSTSNASCVACHSLPEGSSNTFFLDEASPPAAVQNNPLENAQIRGLVQREKAYIAPGEFDPVRETSWTRTADFGLMRNGVGKLSGEAVTDERSINNFNLSFPISVFKRRAMNEFCRQFDWGVAPMIGQAVTVDKAIMPNGPPSLPQALGDRITAMEESANEANSGIAIYRRSDDGQTVLVEGYWYDAALHPGDSYRDIDATTTLSRDDVLGLIENDGDVLVFQAVPTGSERRVAHPTGTPAALIGPSPSSLELIPMAANTAFEPVTQFTVMVDPGAGNPERFESIDQRMAFVDEAQGVLGVPSFDRHEPPRRFRVVGHDIRHGAKLKVDILQGDPAGGIGGLPRVSLWLDLAATKHRFDNKVVWESAEELDPRMTYAFVHGGSELKPVKMVLNDKRHKTGPLTGQLKVDDLDPTTLNDYTIEVHNQQAGSIGSATGQKVELNDDRAP